MEVLTFEQAIASVKLAVALYGWVFDSIAQGVSR